MDNPSQADLPKQSLFKRLLQLLRIFKTPDTVEDLGHEIQELIEDGEEQGLISSQEGMMLNSIIDFRDTEVSEIMTPRTEMTCAPSTATIAEIIKLITEKGYTRIPIYTESPDHISGILHAKDLLLHCHSGDIPPTAISLTKPALIVMENHKIVDLLKEFKTRKIHMAIVNDEFASVRGLVTLEDIIEEIVGEIFDESDVENTILKKIDKDTVLIDAKEDIEEIENYFDIELPDGPYESVGGLVINHMGKLPAVGDSIEHHGLNFQVTSATKRRINKVKVQRIN